jgi:lipopolysaccharide transport system ATP-binding protein
MSSSDTIISVEGLSKSYLIGHERQTRGYQTFRESLLRGLKGFGRAAVDTLRGRQILDGEEIEEFWALKDVSFEVKRGEVLGIIGRNGAGKSTLLKILSRITEPTEGRVRIKGRVASLLEVGTGFHAELTGRENIFLNGAILGMSKTEIKRKFDEIVAFAEVEKFLDTPVKRYSSGMYVRLAFAVAAHMEPEILIVDEVLAVGDAEFQKKCLGKMNEVANGGRTVIFVSHNMDALRRTCVTGLVLASGRTLIRDTIEHSIEQYLSQVFKGQAHYRIEFSKQTESKPHVTRIELLDAEARPLSRPKTFDHVIFRIYFFSPSRVTNGSVVLYISLPGGTLLTLCSTTPDSSYLMQFEPGDNVIDCDFPKLLLSAGEYVIGAGLAIPNVEYLDYQPEAGTFVVGGRDVFCSGMAPTAQRYPIPMPHSWATRDI